MANKKITELVAATSAVNADLVPVVTDVGTSPTTKKITVSDLKASLFASPTLTGTTTSGVINATGTVSATEFSGSGASLNSIPASAISSGTLAAARIPTTLSSATTFSAGGNAVVISNSGRLRFAAPSGTPNAIEFNGNGTTGYFNNSTAASVPGWNSTGGPVGNGWLWVRVSYNDGAGQGYIPVLI